MLNINYIIKRVVNDPDYVACLNENEIESCLKRVKPILEKERAYI